MKRILKVIGIVIFAILMLVMYSIVLYAGAVSKA